MQFSHACRHHKWCVRDTSQMQLNIYNKHVCNCRGSKAFQRVNTKYIKKYCFVYNLWECVPVFLILIICICCFSFVCCFCCCCCCCLLFFGDLPHRQNFCSLILYQYHSAKFNCLPPQMSHKSEFWWHSLVLQIYHSWISGSSKLRQFILVTYPTQPSAYSTINNGINCCYVIHTSSLIPEYKRVIMRESLLKLKKNLIYLIIKFWPFR